MSLILILSISIRLAALGWSVVLWRRVRDWRMSFFTVMLALMALRQILTLISTGSYWPVSLTGQATELPGLLVSVMAFLAIIFLERLLTDRERAEQRIRSSEEKFSKAFHLSPNAISITRYKDGRYLDVNDSFLRILGTTREEVIGQSAKEFFPGLALDDRERLSALMQKQGYIRDFEASFRRKTGDPGTVSISCERIDLDDEPYVLSISRDITENKRFQEQVQYQANLLQNVSDAIIATDLNFAIESWNRAAEKLYGWQAEEVRGKRMNEVVPTTFGEAGRAEVLTQFRETGLWKGEVIQHRRDGTPVDILASVTMIRDSAGQPTGVVAVNRDITERKRAEEALRENEERNRMLLEAAFEGIVISEKGRILEANRAFAAMYGYDLDEVLGLSPLEMTTPESARRIMEHIERGAEKPYEIVGRKKDGSLFDLEVVGKNCTYQGRPARIVAMRDITPRKQAEEALRESKEQYRALFEEAREARHRLERLSRRLVDVQEQERRHIAMELHDEIGQTLTALKLVLETADLSASPAISKKLKKAQAFTDALADKIRDLSLDLRPTMLDDFGLLPTLEWHVERYAARTRIGVDLRASGLADKRLSTELETAAYRIVQEALTNVARHAATETVTVHARLEDDALELHIEDAGTGFDVAHALNAHATGGLSGMRERAALIGGDVTISSDLGRGTCITAVLPVRKERAS